MNPSELTAIDVHVHLEPASDGTATASAAAKYFGGGIRLKYGNPMPIDDVADRNSVV